MRIHYLKDRPDDIPTLAKWFEEEWGAWYGPGRQGNAKTDLLACCQRNALPLALVAVNGDGRVMGTAALKPESLGSELGYAPWLAAVIVGPRYRRNGVGTALIAAIEEEACRLGFNELYVSTDAAESLITGRGWRPTGDRIESLRGLVQIYFRKL